MKIKIIMSLLVFILLCMNVITVDAVGTTNYESDMSLTPQKVVPEEAKQIPVEPLEVEDVGISVDLYNEVSGGAYYTGYPVYGTDYVLDCSTYFCNVNGYVAIVINEVYSTQYPRGTIAKMEVDGTAYSVMVVDYRAMEHSDKIYEVGVIGKSTNGKIPATIYEE